MSLNVTQSNNNLTLQVSQSNVKSTLSVTQNINELHITAIQNNEITKLQPVLNSSNFTETDPIFQASEASLFVAGDKANLDNQSGVNTGDETTSSIQAKRPIKTINGESLEGSGNIQIDYNDLDNLPTLITNHSGLNLDDGTNPHGTTKNDIGLDNVDNTSDIDKPISTATQNALDLKENIVDKAIDFSIVNDTLYPSVKAVDDFIKSQRLEVPFINVASITINHNLNRFCTATAFLSDGSFALCDYHNIDNNNIFVEFSTQQTGKIILI